MPTTFALVFFTGLCLGALVVFNQCISHYPKQKITSSLGNLLPGWSQAGHFVMQNFVMAAEKQTETEQVFFCCSFVGGIQLGCNGVNQTDFTSPPPHQAIDKMLFAYPNRAKKEVNWARSKSRSLFHGQMNQEQKLQPSGAVIQGNRERGMREKGKGSSKHRSTKHCQIHLATAQRSDSFAQVMALPLILTHHLHFCL